MLKNRVYFVFLVALLVCAPVAGFITDASVRYWVWAGAALLLYLWCKDVLTGKGWLQKPQTLVRRELTAEKKQVAVMSEAEDLSTFPDLNETEREGYVRLTRLCTAPGTQAELIAFFATLKDYSIHEEYGITLNYVMEYLETNDIPFINRLDWKAPVTELSLQLQSSLQSNFAMTIDLPDAEKYGAKASVSFEGIFSDYDLPLRKQGFQIGFIGTNADEYVFLLHRVADKESVENAVTKTGYSYFDTGAF